VRLSVTVAAESNASGPAWLDEIVGRPTGLVPVIAQDAATGRRADVRVDEPRGAPRAPSRLGEAVYWSRSRGQALAQGRGIRARAEGARGIRVDCDNDVLLLKIEQVGGIACHTGRESCFFRRLENGVWVAVDPVLKDPGEIYKS
jgi:phosphoribosyl-AMP cyclohydrolase